MLMTNLNLLIQNITAFCQNHCTPSARCRLLLFLKVCFVPSQLPESIIVGSNGKGKSSPIKSNNLLHFASNTNARSLICYGSPAREDQSLRG